MGVSVSDVVSNRKMLNMLLKKKGITSEMVADGQEAVDLIAKALLKFHIVFM